MGDRVSYILIRSCVLSIASNSRSIEITSTHTSRLGINQWSNAESGAKPTRPNENEWNEKKKPKYIHECARATKNGKEHLNYTYYVIVVHRAEARTTSLNWTFLEVCVAAFGNGVCSIMPLLLLRPLLYTPAAVPLNVFGHHSFSVPLACVTMCSSRK